MSMLLLKLPLNIFHVSRLHCRGFIPVKYRGSRYAKSKLKNLDSILNWPKKNFNFSSRDPSNCTRVLAILAKNSAFVFFDGDNPITENNTSLRSPSPIMTFLTGSNAFGGGGGWGRTTEINESTHAHFTKLLTIASMIALQVVRTSYVWEVASPQPPPPPVFSV